MTTIELNLLTNGFEILYRILGLIPLATLAVLSPQLHSIVIAYIADVVLFALKHAIVKEDHFVPTAPLPTEKMERTMQKMYAMTNFQ